MPANPTVMPHEVTLRRATAGDAHAVAQVLRSSREAFLPYARQAHTQSDVEHWTAQVLLPAGGVTVACAGARLIGVLAVKVETSQSWIEQMYISPGFVGGGIGTQMLNQVLPSLPRPVRLYTFQENQGARRFYERFGFHAVQFSDGSSNEEGCPDVLYELIGGSRHVA